MHILCVHQNYPAQFGHILRFLAEEFGWRCSFATERPPKELPRTIQIVPYRVEGGATSVSHYSSRTFENFIRRSDAVYEALKSRRDIGPDLVVGHSGFGSTLFLADLYDCPIVNYFEYFYRANPFEGIFREGEETSVRTLLRSRARNACFLLDLQTCTLGYSPTHWQTGLFPCEYHDKIETIFDGIDTSLWKPAASSARRALTIFKRTIPADAKVVTYVARGFEPIRGFDIFMQVADRICRARDDVYFICVGGDKIHYGNELARGDYDSYRQRILSEGRYRLDRFYFPGMLPAGELVKVFHRSDLHIYLTEPFILSWSLMDALACGCVVLGSDTSPVQEMIRHGENGLLGGFFDVEGLTEHALEVLGNPHKYRAMRDAAVQTIRDHYSLEKTMPKLIALYERAIALGNSGPKRQTLFSDDGAARRVTVAATLPHSSERIKLTSGVRSNGNASRAMKPANKATEQSPRIASAPAAQKAIAGGGIVGLRTLYPWPLEKPNENAFVGSRAPLASPSSLAFLDQMLAQVLTRGDEVVIDLRPRLGYTSCYLSNFVPRGCVIAVDRWSGSLTTRGPQDAVRVVPDAYAAFVDACWDYRERITPVRRSVSEGFELIEKYGVVPHAIVISGSGYEHTLEDLRLAYERFPQAQIIGTGWRGNDVGMAARFFLRRRRLELEVLDDAWRIWNEGSAWQSLRSLVSTAGAP
jgi:glycosyltransferase involved in cell wall biosynthesis